MEYDPREGPRVWMEVKYGTVEGLKGLIKVCTHDEVSAIGGPFLTSPLHEAVYRMDLGMVDLLRYSLCDIECTIGGGSFKGKTPLEYAEYFSSIAGNPSDSYDICWSLRREVSHRPKRVRQRALCVQRRTERDLMLAFACIRHERLGNAANIILHTTPDDVMKLVFQYMETDE